MAEDSMEQDVQTEEEFDNSVENPSEDTISADDSASSETLEPQEDEGEPEITAEQIDALDDDQFNAFMESGKLPTAKAKTVESGDNTVQKPKKQEAVTEQVASTEPKQTQPDIDYKSVYDSIFRPFKANGKEITPRTTEDVISLMQMGANYTKKMKVMAPMMRAMQTLNNAKIGEEDLNFLIDLHNGDKEAIKKLLQKNSVDPMDLDLETTNYVSKNHIASDEDVRFQDVINDIGEDYLPTVENIVNKKWDAESKRELLKNPDLLRKLGEEVQMGRFDAIQQVLDEERTFGRYKGVSDLEAYTDIVTKYVNYMNQKQASKPKQQTQPTRSVQSRPTNTSNKAKAAPTRTNNVSRGKANFTANDIFSMSEEDFNKLSINDLI